MAPIAPTHLKVLAVHPPATHSVWLYNNGELTRATAAVDSNNIISVKSNNRAATWATLKNIRPEITWQQPPRLLQEHSRALLGDVSHRCNIWIHKMRLRRRVMMMLLPVTCWVLSAFCTEIYKVLEWNSENQIKNQRESKNIISHRMQNMFAICIKNVV